MAVAYDYSGEVAITITNAIDVNCCKYAACDAGTPVQKVEMKYSEIKDRPCVKFDYVFDETGAFKKDGDDYVVLVYQKFKNTDRKVPAYRTFNGKVLKPGDSVTFVTQNKDEVVFYEKVVTAFGSKLTSSGVYEGGELTMTVVPAPVVTETVVTEETDGE
jgi:hypothetical protein